jgi:hypothetical protein
MVRLFGSTRRKLGVIPTSVVGFGLVQEGKPYMISLAGHTGLQALFYLWVSTSLISFAWK